jgi:Asp-tRNA(Asn)/Glu-tRNA(Gln) amidotransferase A subunit family amidase
MNRVSDNVKVDQEVSNAFDTAVATLRSLGHAVSDASAPLTDLSKGIANVEADRKAIGHLAFKDIDALVLPTTPTVTPTVEDAANNPLALSSQLTMFANYYGLPAVSVRDASALAPDRCSCSGSRPYGGTDHRSTHPCFVGVTPVMRARPWFPDIGLKWSS